MMASRTRIIAGVWIGLAFSSTAFAQFTGAPQPGNPPLSSAKVVVVSGSVTVFLRTQDGQDLPQTAAPLIHVMSTANYFPLPNTASPTGGGWLLTGLAGGQQYQIQVSAIGFLPAVETVEIPDTEDASTSVIIFMRPVDQELVFRPPAGSFVLAPKAAKEMQHALQDLQDGKIASAQKHTLKAMHMAPANPYVQYVMGMTYLLSRQFQQAKPYLEKSVSIDPKESTSLSALGTVRYQLGDDAGAIEVFTKAVQLDPKSWKSEWLLAASYLQQKDFPEARDHAERALKIDKAKAGQVQILLGQALAALGDREGAAQAFDTFAQQYPKDPNAATARDWAKRMRQPRKPAVTPASSPSLPLSAPGTSSITLFPEPPPAEIPPRPDWAPLDVDAEKPFVIAGATCPLQRVLRKAGKNAEELVTTLQEFSATEDFQAIELKRGEQLEKPSERAFDYLVFINRVSPEVFNVREVRDNKAAQGPWPGRVEDTGVAALALAFHPVIQPDLDWKCEGLGTWDQQAAWVIHFQQKPKAPNVLASFTGPLHNYSLPLKGRAWVSERSGQVLHLETDLVKEIQPIDLKREHFAVDYKPVYFSAHRVQLWLPESVDTYIQYQGHFLHYYHHFSDFKLFWVGSTQKISAPKDAQEKDEQRNE